MGRRAERRGNCSAFSAATAGPSALGRLPVGGERAGGGGGVAADPLVLPGAVELLLVAAGLVDRAQLLGDLPPVAGLAPGDLEPRDVQLPLAPGSAYPAGGSRVAERQAFLAQVVGVADEDHGVRLGGLVGAVEDGVPRRNRR